MNRIEKGNRPGMNSMNRLRTNAIARQPRLEVRNHRYLNLFDAMRKSVKNREKTKAQGNVEVLYVVDLFRETCC